MAVDTNVPARLVIVRATDASGRFAVRHGVLDTDERHARVVFQRIHVLYDGDKGANRGELTFRMRAENRLTERKEDRIGSGKSVHAPDGNFVFHGAAQILTVGGQGEERDSNGVCVPFNSAGWRATNVGRMQHRCNRVSRWTHRTWSTAWVELDLDAPLRGGGLPTGFGGVGLLNFAVRQAEPRVQPRFEVTGFVEVWYE